MIKTQSANHNKYLQVQLVLPKRDPFVSSTSQPNKELLEKSYDLDSVFGTLSLKDFANSFKDTLNLQLSSSETANKFFDKIRVNCFSKIEGQTYNVRKLPHAKIGTASTSIGLIDVFIILCHKESLESTSSATEIIYFAIRDIINSAKSQMRSGQFLKEYNIDSLDLEDHKFSGNLVVSDYEYFFSELENKLSQFHPKVYVETFGNKNFTCTTAHKAGIQSIQSKLQTIFSCPKVLKMLFVDICISVSTGNDQVTFANNNFYKNLGVRPNYFPLFSNSAPNLNINTYDYKTGNLNYIGKKYSVYKFNCYSTYKYLFAKDNSNSCSVPVSLALLVNNIFNTRISGSKNKFNELCSEISSIKVRYDNRPQKSYPFRVEMRCKYKNMGSVFNNFEKYINKQSCFQSVQSEIFFNQIKHNLDIFLEIMGYNCYNSNTNAFIDFDEIITASVAELIMKNCYLAGWLRCPLLSKITRPSILTRLNRDFIFLDSYIPPLISAITQNLQKDEKSRFLNQIINYNTALNGIQKIFFSYAADIFFEVDDVNSHKMCLYLFKTYILQTTSDLSNFEISVLIKDTGQDEIITKIQASKAFFEIFVKPKVSGKQSLSHLLFKICKMKLDKTDDEFIKLIFDYAKTIGISHIFKKNRFHLNNNNNCHKSMSFLELDYSLEQFETELHERSICFDIFSSYSITSNINRKFNTDELIRYIHALFRYTNSSKRLIDILNDFAYGFSPLRNLDWIKNRLKTLKTIFKNKEQFFYIMQKVKEWDPSFYSIESRKLAMQSSGISLSETQLETWIMLTNYDINSWNKSLVRNMIKDASPSEIFISAVLSKGKREKNQKELFDISLMEQINKWNNEYIIKNSSEECLHKLVTENICKDSAKSIGAETIAHYSKADMILESELLIQDQNQIVELDCNSNDCCNSSIICSSELAIQDNSSMVEFDCNSNDCCNSSIICSPQLALQDQNQIVEFDCNSNDCCNSSIICSSQLALQDQNQMVDFGCNSNHCCNSSTFTTSNLKVHVSDSDISDVSNNDNNRISQTFKNIDISPPLLDISNFNGFNKSISIKKDLNSKIKANIIDLLENKNQKSIQKIKSQVVSDLIHNKNVSFDQEEPKNTVKIIENKEISKLDTTFNKNVFLLNQNILLENNEKQESIKCGNNKIISSLFGIKKANDILLNPLTPNSSSLDNSDSNLDNILREDLENSYILKLYDRFLFKPFSLLRARNQIFDVTKKPPIKDWLVFIKHHLSLNCLSRLKYNPKVYRFNIQKVNGRFISFNSLFVLIKKHFFDKKFTLNDIQRLFNYKYRCKKTFLSDFLDFLLSEGIIIKEKNGTSKNKQRFYLITR